MGTEMDEEFRPDEKALAGLESKGRARNAMHQPFVVLRRQRVSFPGSSVNNTHLRCRVVPRGCTVRMNDACGNRVPEGTRNPFCRVAKEDDCCVMN